MQTKSSFSFRTPDSARQIKKLIRLIPETHSPEFTADPTQPESSLIACSVSLNNLLQFCNLQICPESLARFMLTRDPEQDIFLMESALHEKENGRYSFLGIHPESHYYFNENGIFLQKPAGLIRLEEENPTRLISELLDQRKAALRNDLPPFASGIAGMFSFEYFRSSEPTIPAFKENPNHLDDFDLMVFDSMICFDHYENRLLLTRRISDQNDRSEPVSSIQEDLKNDLAFLLAEYAEYFKNRSAEQTAAFSGHLKSHLVPRFSQSEFEEMVMKAKRHIQEGDIFQIVLSNPHQALYEGRLFESYRSLKSRNPSPYLFYFHSDHLEAVGSSPETLVSLRDDLLKTFPLAGTRKRGKNPEEDQRLEKELLSDPKEIAEHSMLVDLGRNDLGKVSLAGSVHVDSLMQVQRFSKVMHLGSEIVSEMKPEARSIDALCSVHPAGTLSGAPKIRACQLIHDLEGHKRGIYGGAFGYLDDRGGMDFCIAIRLASKSGSMLTIQSGAGIVADSSPALEYQECLAKASAVIEAVQEVSL